jgi:hypothetical protein
MAETTNAFDVNWLSLNQQQILQNQQAQEPSPQQAHFQQPAPLYYGEKLYVGNPVDISRRLGCFERL